MKLVGCTISCTYGAHIQSYFVVTDLTGLEVIMKDEADKSSFQVGMFGCYPSKSDTIMISELGMSRRILKSNYQIDCIMAKYQGLDFSPGSNATCSILGNPYADRSVDGISLEPYEVVFIKYSDLNSASESQERAKLYEKWMTESKLNRRS